MRRRSTLAPALLLALALPAVPAAARDRCHADGIRTVALTAQIRVFQDAHDGYYYGCLRRTGKRTELWDQDDIYVTGAIRAVRGRFVAYTWNAIPACKADCPPEVRTTNITAVTDLRTGRTRDLHDGSVYALILRPRGSVAWVAEAAPDSELSVWPLGGPAALLDQGDIHAVQARAGTLTWTNSDGPHAAPFAWQD
jgi:hypothetical protein